MTVFLRRGTESFRWDVATHCGRPPNVAPPRWAAVESLWGFLGDAPVKPPALAPNSVSWAEEAARKVREKLPRARRLCLVVPDHTRPGVWTNLLDELLDAFHQDSGYEMRTLLVATGTHAPSRQPDRKSSPGWTRLENSADSFSSHRSVGKTAVGTPVALHPAYLDADARVLFGETSYHYFAGFGGGPKLVFPGCAEPQGAGQNHRLALVDAGTETERWHPECAVGCLADNPVHKDLMDAATLAPATWMITAVQAPDSNADPAQPTNGEVEIVQGPFPEGLPNATKRFDQHYRLEFTQRPELFLADAGGAPRDHSFLQAHKSLQSARQFVQRDGRVLLVAQCSSGWGSAEIASRASGVEPSAPSLHRQTWFALQDVLSRHRVGLWSNLPAQEVERVGMEPLQSEAEAFSWIGSPRSWGWLPRAERFRPGPGWLGGRTGETISSPDDS